jgi:hypothetical protein
MKTKKSNHDSKQPNAEFTSNDLKVRLDGIVMLLMGLRFSDEKGNLRLVHAAKLLHKVGYTPTEIAKLFGKKKATEVSTYLY